MPRVGDKVYFTELRMLGWLHLTWWLCLFFQIMGICPLLVFVSSVHSTLGNRAANLNGRKKRSRQHNVMSRSQTQMPRQGVWQNLRARRQSRHLVSSRLVSLPSTFHLVVVTFGMQETESFSLSVGQRKQKELNSAGQWFLRGKPQTWCLKIFLIWTSKFYKVEPLTWSAQVPSHNWTSVWPPWGIWLFLVPDGVTSTHTKRDLRWGLRTNHLKFPSEKLVEPQSHLPGPGEENSRSWAKKGPLQSDVRGRFLSFL